MRPLRWIGRRLVGVGRWLRDPRTGIAVAVSIIAGAVIAFVLMSGLTTRDALRTRDRSAAAATRRIDLLQDEIAQLRVELVNEARTNGNRIGELTDQVAVLQEQIRQMGGDPVVAQALPAAGPSPAAPTTTVAPTAPRPTPTTTTVPPAAPRPAPESDPAPGGVCLLGICIGG